jgi:hypothetical protein
MPAWKLRQRRKELDKREHELKAEESRLRVRREGLNAWDRRLEAREQEIGPFDGPPCAIINRHGYTVSAPQTIKYGADDIFVFKLGDGTEVRLPRRNLRKIEMAES